MSMPTFEELKVPILHIFEDGQNHRVPEIIRPLADQFGLREDEIAEVLPSGQETRWHNRVSWALYDLYKAGLLERVKRGTYVISALGKDVAASKPRSLDRAALLEYPAYRRWHESFGSGTLKPELAGEVGVSRERTEGTPEERMASAHLELRQGLVAEVLELLKGVDPIRFEQIVLDLLLAMGYGGSLEEAASLTKRSGDEGIDGVINEDRLGLDVIYIQAKRWQETVGRKEIQSFVGALAGKQAQKGIFITTSNFAKTAVDYASGVQQKVILIDGERLADLMIEHNVGVSLQRVYDIKQVDSDYFEG